MAFSVPAAGQSVALKAPQRDFGYVVGDVIVTEAVITSIAGNTLEARTLPVPGPLSASIELRRIDLRKSDASGATILRMEYQNFLAPDRVMQTELPGYDIQFTTGVAHVPAWPFHVSPLRVAQRSVDDMGDLRGNLPVPPVSLRSAVVGMLVSASIAAVAGFVWGGLQGWLPGMHRKTRPFARAAQRIGRLKPHHTEAALRELQHAFDCTDGRHVFGEDVDGFLARHEAFAGLHAEIGHVFETIRACFFAPSHAVCDNDFRGIVALAKALRRAERRW